MACSLSPALLTVQTSKCSHFTRQRSYSVLIVNSSSKHFTVIAKPLSSWRMELYAHALLMIGQRTANALQQSLTKNVTSITLFVSSVGLPELIRNVFSNCIVRGLFNMLFQFFILSTEKRIGSVVLLCASWCVFVLLLCS